MSRFMGHWRNYFVAATDAPHAFGEAAGLMALSTIALGYREAALGRGIAPNLYMLLVGDSTTARKSTCVRFVRQLLKEVAPHLVGPSDYTMEGLYKWMQRKDPETNTAQSRLCLINEEFGQVLSKAGSGGYNGSFRGDMCSLYDGEDITKVRAVGPALGVMQPRISCVGGVSYGFLGQMCTKDDWLSGFLVRFLFVAPSGMRKPFLHWPPHPETKFDLAVKELQSIYSELKATGMQRLAVTPQAAAFLNDYVAERQSVVIDESHTENEKVIGPTYVGRFALNLQKLALIYQLDEDPHAPVGIAAAEKAVGFSGYALWRSYRVAYDATTGKEFETALSWVLRQAREPDGVAKRDIYMRFMASPQLPAQLYSFCRNSGALDRALNSGGQESFKLD